jgi:hypothetical protein
MTILNPVIVLGVATLTIGFVGRLLWTKFQNFRSVLLPVCLLFVTHAVYCTYNGFGRSLCAFLWIVTGGAYIFGGLLGMLVEYCMKKEPFGFVR